MTIILDNQGQWFLLLFMKKPKPKPIKSSWKVAVVTSFVPKLESKKMLEETLKALVALDYPHDTWLLDEEDNDQIKKLCVNLGVKHFSRKNVFQYQSDHGTFKSYSKYGNYNSWLYTIGFKQYDIISAFDPDHIPKNNFLSRVLGYFEDSKIAYVQTPQAYYNQNASFIARGAAEETYVYYSSAQMANYGMDYPIIVGCHNTHRVSALKQVGGFAAHDADDLLLTLLYRSHGWKGVYVPEILAKGLTPVDWDGYIKQQRRWTRSILDIKMRYYTHESSKVEFKSYIMGLLHGFNYLFKSFIILFGLILLLYLLISGISPMAISIQTLLRFILLCGALYGYELYRKRFYLDRRNEWVLHWRIAVLQYAKWAYCLLAFFDVILNRKIPYELTNKMKSKKQSYILLRSHLPTVILICIAWIIGFISGRITDLFLHFCATIVVTGTLALILTEYLKFPEPFDKKLSKKVF